MELKHDTVVRRLRAAARAIELRRASDAWIASLGSGPVRNRSVLAHLAYATNFPEHRFVPSGGEQSYLCAICGGSQTIDVDQEDILESLHSSGDTIIAEAETALVDLERFVREEPIAPTLEDVARLDAMLEVIARLPAGGRATDLVKRWGKLVPKTNAYARAALVETLGACGILETVDHPGHLTRWVGFWEYEEVPATTGDMRPPEAWWRRSDGVNREALELVFPQRGIDRSRFPRARALTRKLVKGAITLPKKGKNPALELRSGDLIGIEYEGRWLAGVVLGVTEKTIPVIEFYAGSFATRPDPRSLSKATARVAGPYRGKPHFRREPLALQELELFGSVMSARLERLARDQAAPRSGGAPSTHFRVIAPRNLLYVLSTLATSL
jgi:hypothetical protein